MWILKMKLALYLEDGGKQYLYLHCILPSSIYMYPRLYIP